MLKHINPDINILRDIAQIVVWPEEVSNIFSTGIEMLEDSAYEENPAIVFGTLVTAIALDIEQNGGDIAIWSLRLKGYIVDDFKKWTDLLRQLGFDMKFGTKRLIMQVGTKIYHASPPFADEAAKLKLAFPKWSAYFDEIDFTNHQSGRTHQIASTFRPPIFAYPNKKQNEFKDAFIRLKNEVIKRYEKRELNLDACLSIAENASQLAHKVSNNTVTQMDINAFYETAKIFHPYRTLFIILICVLSSALGALMGSSIGLICGGMPGFILGGIAGAAVGASIGKYTGGFFSKDKSIELVQLAEEIQEPSYGSCDERPIYP